MKKNVYYFPHDSNAQHDPKICALLQSFGWEGYGLYWAIIETLHEQPDGKLKKFPALFEGLAYQLKVSSEALLKQIEAMVKHFFLLEEDENFIWSNRVCENLNTRNSSREKKIEAGRLGGQMSGIARNRSNAEALLRQNEALLRQNEALLEANEPKEIKLKEIKLKEIKVDINNNTVGQNSPTACFEILNYLNQKLESNYKPTTPKTQRLIAARLQEGFTVEQFFAVIDKKTDTWIGTEFEKFLRPETLFGTKFESYLNEVRTPIRQAIDKGFLSESAHKTMLASEALRQELVAEGKIKDDRL